jgi:hypothetical protein
VTGVYSDFGAHAMAALEMTAATAGVELHQEDRQAVARQMRACPPTRRCPARSSGWGWQWAGCG